MPAVRVSEELHEKIAAAARLEGRSAANYVDWTLRPILDAALESTSGNGRSVVPASRRASGANSSTSTRASTRASKAAAKAAAKPKTRGRASKEWTGCGDHPNAGAVSVPGGRMACGEPGCANGARMASA